MDTIDRDTLGMLLETQDDGPCVSIFVPTHEVGPEAKQGSIRLKNLLSKVERKLDTTDLSAKQVDKLLRPVRKLVDDTLFWKHQRNGLAILLAPGTFHHFRLPIEVQEAAIVGHRFYMKPLLRLFSLSDFFYVLALSQQHIRLLQCTPHSVSRVELVDAPENIAEVLQYDDPQKQGQFHTKTAPAGPDGTRSAISYGHGDENYERHENLRRYFRAVDASVCKTLKNHGIPLVFAGVDYLFPIYREVTKYTGLLEDFLEGSPETARDKELQRQVWPIVKPVFQQYREKDKSRYHQLLGTGQASSNIADIVFAARDGRIDTLFLAAETSLAGAIDHQTNTVEQNPDSEAAAEDLLEYAAVQTYLHKGAIHTVAPDEMPNGSHAAAIYRY